MESFGVIVTASSVYGWLTVLYAVEFCYGNLELYLSGCSTELGFEFFLPGLGVLTWGSMAMGKKLNFAKTGLWGL